MWVLIHARILLILFLALASAAESGDQDPNPYAPPQSAPEPVSPKSAKQFAHDYDWAMERYGWEVMLPGYRALCYIGFGVGVGGFSFGSMESAPVGSVISGFTLVGLPGLQLYADYLFFNRAKSDVAYQQVKHNLLQRPEFSHFRLEPEEATKEADRCHASFAAIANPFRRSRFLSRWAPAIAGGVAFVSLGETLVPGNSVRAMKRFLRWGKLIAPR